MRPVLEQTAFPRCTPGGPVQKGLLVRAEPGKRGKVVGPGQDVDAVDLMQSNRLDGATKVTLVNLLGPRRPEPLGGQGNSACFRRGELLSHAYPLATTH